MANASIAQAVSRQTVASAIRQARIQAAEHRAWINAINKAAINLEVCRWAFDGDNLRIQSATTSNTYYTVTVHECPCKAGQAGRPCWHRAAVRLLIKAAEIVYTPGATNGYQDAPLYPFEDAPPSYAALTQAINDLLN